MIRDEVYLRNVLDAIEVILGYADVGEEVFMRDRLIHGYASLDLNTVWRTVVQDVPPLREAVHRLLGRA